MNSNDALIGKLEQLKDSLVSRLDGLIMCKFGGVRLSFDDVDERIDECIKAMDRLQDSIDKLRSM